jgi:hypothetical protein
MIALSDLFTDEVVQRLAAVVRTNVSPWDDGGVPVRRRHEIVRCVDHSASQSGWALKRAWESYLEAAKDCGLLDDAELVENLTGTDDDSFRGALAECNAAWFLRQLGLTVAPKPEPKNGKNIDFAVVRGELTFYVEVKAPYVPQLTNHGSGDDAHVLRGRVEAAGTQFKKGRCNVLLLVPVLRTSIHSFGEQLVKAVLGEHALRISVSLDPSVKAPPPELVFKQDGKLARLHPQPDGSVKADLTRISAVVSLEYVFGYNDREEREVRPRVTVVHNPFAEVPLPAEVFAPFPQLVRRDDGDMEWTDAR